MPADSRDIRKAWRIPTATTSPRASVSATTPVAGKTVVRAGYGGFYAYPEMNLWCNQVHNVPLVFPEVKTSNNFVPRSTASTSASQSSARRWWVLWH